MLMPFFPKTEIILKDTYWYLLRCFTAPVEADTYSIRFNFFQLPKLGLHQFSNLRSKLQLFLRLNFRFATLQLFCNVCLNLNFYFFCNVAINLLWPNPLNWRGGLSVNVNMYFFTAKLEMRRARDPQ